MVTMVEVLTMLAATQAVEMLTLQMYFLEVIKSTLLPLLVKTRLIAETKVRPSSSKKANFNYSLVILPTSALHELSRLKISYPMTFMISNPQMNVKSYCGVLEFSAEEGMCHIPVWMMENLCVEEGSEIILRNMNLKKGTFIKIRPHETKFIDLANPKAM